MEFKTAHSFLKIAEKHLELVSTSKSERITIPGPEIDDCTVAIIFSAIAVESALNQFIKTHILLIKERVLQDFFGLLSVSYNKISIIEKIKFIQNIVPEINNQEILISRIKELFQTRNSLVHNSYEFVRPKNSKCLVTTDDGSDYTELKEMDLFNYLSMKGIGSDVLENSVIYYDAANELINILSIESNRLIEQNGC